MVKKIGFMYDGETEEIILKSDSFKDYLLQRDIQLIGPVKFNYGKINYYTEHLQNKGAVEIIILKDLEQLSCYSELKNQLNPFGISNIHKVIGVKKMMEAWFLADDDTIRKILRIGASTPFNSNHNPETVNNPYEKICELLKQHSNSQGQKFNKKKPTKTLLAKRFIDNGFTIENASKHPNCPSAKYFIDYLG